MESQLESPMAADSTSSCRVKIQATVVVMLTNMALAFRVESFGTTLVDMQLYTGGSTAQMSLVFVFGSVAGILSSITLVPLMDRYNPFLMMGIVMVVTGVLGAAQPWSTSVAAFVALGSLAKYPQSLIAPGSFFILAGIWKEDAGPSMQLSEAIYAGSAALAAVVAMPFLNKKISSSSTTEMSSEFTTNHDANVSVSNCCLQTNVNVTGLIQRTTPQYMTLGIGSDRAETTYFPTRENYQETQAQFVYVISGGLLILVGLMHFWNFCTVGRCRVRESLFAIKSKNKIKQNKDKSECESGEKRTEFEQAGLTNCTSQWSKIGFYLFCSTFSLFVGGMIFGYAGFLLSYAYRHLTWPKDTSALLLTAYNASGATGCALHIYLTRKFRPDLLLLIGIVLGLISTIMLIFFAHINIVTWTSCILFGAALYPMLGLMQAWGQKVITADGKFQAFCFSGLQAGFLCIPSLLGLLFDVLGPISFPYVIFCCVLGSGTSGLAMKALQLKLVSKLETKTENVQPEINNENYI